MNKEQELQELKGSIKDLQKQFTKARNDLERRKLYHETKAISDVNHEPAVTFHEFDMFVSDVMGMVDRLHDRIFQMEDEIFKLKQNPLANIKSREQMQRVIERLGLENEFTVPQKEIRLMD